MSLEKLLAAGGTAVGGVVYVGREAMGQFAPDGFVLLEAGKTFLGAENAVLSPVESTPAPAKKTARAPAAPAKKTASAPGALVQEPAPAEESGQGDELGGLLP